ncbi:MAG: GIY-YIG nuclease family protein [Candidatus Omnitrophica bacterium]|nr:GIY-YIG nuclease family protein [Candidatus Omnitrophota bacterium]
MNRDGIISVAVSDIEKRLRRHNQNSVRATKHRGPFKVIYKEEYSSRSEALKREHEIKSYKGNNKFDKLFTTYVPIV